MKSLKTLVCATSFAMCFGAASMASAASVSPDGPFSTNAGTIVVKSPSSFGAAVTCGITFTGNVSGGVASINGATLTGGGLCALPTLTNLPWVLTAATGTTGTVTNVGYKINSIPATNCGPTPIAVTWAAGTKTLSAANQSLSGNCTVVSLNVVAPTLTVNP
ncbi:protein activator of alkane oxidation PraB [Pseudomonas sp. R2-37-08W]|uniref:alkane oxidation protein activator PraB n=1 Tax=unclassified Pseudomonas TaxID=196821 RepID=UPI000F562BB5|nr:MULTISPECIES: alkane oxidation protein activator PraB [unclassified Pseudomonas]AZF10725.1 protein activator of alkane oxidation PraB [Pseudomonas sp. R2-37-08W]AZF47659.1 protein activator of alkane oxidation PraB [Pseudomonas sp. R2-7-07]AZF58202.1 protein activator of alkane oxidation PraB [Pseudomonas sp. R11-23-07]